MRLFFVFFISTAWAAPALATETISYSYDAQGRFVQANVSGSGDNANLSISYQYDLTNNRLTLTTAGSKNRGQQIVVVPLNGFTLIPVNP